MKSYLPILVAIAALGPCSKKTDRATPISSDTPVAVTSASSASTAAPAASASASASATTEPDVIGDPACSTANQKVWTKGVNTITGLTAEEFADGSDVIGLAVGNAPHVLVVKEGASGTLRKVTVDPGSAFAKAPKAAEGTRTLLRVTPVKVETAAVRAFVDYRDDLKAAAPNAPKTRRVVCGPADVAEKWVLWEGPAYLDDPKSVKDPIPALTEAKVLAAGKAYREVRDCRTFSNPRKGDTWVVASAFRAEVSGADVKAQSTLVLATPKSDSVLHTTDITTKPFKRADYDAPVSDYLPDGTLFVAARSSAGALVASFATPDKKAKGTPKSFAGFFQVPDLSHDAADGVLLAAQASGKGGHTLRAMRIAGEKLPAGLANVTDEADEAHSASKPEFLRDAKGQRWIAYLEHAEKGKGTLEIMPVKSDFRSAGKPYAITKDDERASEARLFAKPGGGFIVAYIRDGGAAGGELVTEDLECKVGK